MEEYPEKHPARQPFDSDGIASNLTAVFVGLGLLSILFYVPGPVIPVSHPYKAELVFGVMLLLTWAGIRISGLKLKELLSNCGFYSRRIAIWLAAFTSFGLISSFWASSFESVAHHTIIWGLYLSSFITLVSIVYWQKSFKFPLIAISTGAAVTGTLCLIDYLTMTEFRYLEGFVRVRYGKYGEMMATISPMLIVGAIYLKGRLRILAGVAFLLAWLTVMLSLSKGAFLAGLAGLAVFLIGAFIFDRVGKRKVIAAAAIVWLSLTIGFQVVFSVSSDVPATTDYITGDVDPNFTSSEFRKVIWKVGIHMAKEKWVIGWGADNFGRRFNEARSGFRKENPQDQSTEFGEDYLVERAHNEPIQIVAELGVVGMAMFLTAVIFAGILLLRNIRSENGLVVWATIGGSVAFALSSMVSSFSFRSAQNGIAFFLILSASVGLIDRVADNNVPRRLNKAIIVTMLLLVGFVFIYCGVKIASEIYVNRAESTVDNEEALGDYRAALTIDPEYAGAYLSMAARYASMNDYENAAAMTQKGIDHGIGMSLTYSQLATQYKIAGMPDMAADAYREGIRVYPRSVYMRIEAAEYFASVGLVDEAKANTEAAMAISAKDAEGWIRLIRFGGNRAFYMSKDDGMSTPPAELLPQNTVLMYSEKHPEPEK